MNLGRVRALMFKEWTHILRDRRSLILTLATPILLLSLFGYALTLDVDNVPVIIWDESQTPQSRGLVSHFSGSRFFAVSPIPATGYDDISKAIDARDVLAAIVIPADFESSLQSGRHTSVQLIADGSDANTATIALGYADALMASYDQARINDHYHNLGYPVQSSPIAFQPHVWFNANFESKNNIIPGLIAVIMMVISALMTSLSIAREWEQGSMQQLISTPMKASELILGKLLPYFIIGMIDVFLIVLMGEFVFDVPMRGSPVLLFVMAALFCTGSLCIGLLISSFAKNQLLATQLAMVVTFIPSFLLSGFFNPISSMPYAIQLITYVVPARYFITILKGIYLKGVGLEVLYPEVIILVLFTGTLIFLTHRSLRHAEVGSV